MVNVRSDVHDYSEQVVESVGITHIVDGVKNTQLQWECDAIRQLNELNLGFLEVFLVFESFEMQRKDIG